MKLSAWFYTLLLSASTVVLVPAVLCEWRGLALSRERCIRGLPDATTLRFVIVAQRLCSWPDPRSTDAAVFAVLLLCLSSRACVDNPYLFSLVSSSQSGLLPDQVHHSKCHRAVSSQSSIIGFNDLGLLKGGSVR